MNSVVFCGNFDYKTRSSELERLFNKYGRVEHIDVKNEFAFVYFAHELDDEDAIQGLDGLHFGYSQRKLRVEWSKGERGPRLPDGSRAVANRRPTNTLFVCYFDRVQTKVSDLEKHFEKYGNVVDVRIVKNFAFVQFETKEEAAEALQCTNNSKILGRIIHVEYGLKNDDRLDKGRYKGSPPPYRRRLITGYGRHRSPVHGRYGSWWSTGRCRSRSRVRRCKGDANRSESRSPEYRRSRSRSPVRRFKGDADSSRSPVGRL